MYSYSALYCMNVACAIYYSLLLCGWDMKFQVAINRTTVPFAIDQSLIALGQLA